MRVVHQSPRGWQYTRDLEKTSTKEGNSQPGVKKAWRDAVLANEYFRKATFNSKKREGDRPNTQFSINKIFLQTEDVAPKQRNNTPDTRGLHFMTHVFPWSQGN